MELLQIRKYIPEAVAVAPQNAQRGPQCCRISRGIDEFSVNDQVSHRSISRVCVARRCPLGPQENTRETNPGRCQQRREGKASPDSAFLARPKNQKRSERSPREQRLLLHSRSADCQTPSRRRIDQQLQPLPARWREVPAGMPLPHDATIARCIVILAVLPVSGRRFWVTSDPWQSLGVSAIALAPRRPLWDCLCVATEWLVSRRQESHDPRSYAPTSEQAQKTVQRAGFLQHAASFCRYEDALVRRFQPRSARAFLR